jgi:hypothetical protein
MNLSRLKTNRNNTTGDEYEHMGKAYIDGRFTSHFQRGGEQEQQLLVGEKKKKKNLQRGIPEKGSGRERREGRP